jgi:hypothetical protein
MKLIKQKMDVHDLFLLSERFILMKLYPPPQNVLLVYTAKRNPDPPL